MTTNKSINFSKRLPVVPAHRSDEFIKKLNQSVISKETIKQFKATSNKMQKKIWYSQKIEEPFQRFFCLQNHFLLNDFYQTFASADDDLEVMLIMLYRVCGITD